MTGQAPRDYFEPIIDISCFKATILISMFSLTYPFWDYENRLVICITEWEQEKNSDGKDGKRKCYSWGWNWKTEGRNCCIRGQDGENFSAKYLSFFFISAFHYFECLFIPFLLKIDTDARDAILMSLVSIGCKDVSCHSSIFSVFYCVKIKSIIQFNITCFWNNEPIQKIKTIELTFCFSTYWHDTSNI